MPQMFGNVMATIVTLLCRKNKAWWDLKITQATVNLQGTLDWLSYVLS